MTEHTPGPWKITGGTEVVKRSASGDEALITSLEHTAFRERQEANVRLIVAAPELLDALTEVLSECDRLPTYPVGLANALNVASQAVYKATGEEREATA